MKTWTLLILLGLSGVMSIKAQHQIQFVATINNKSIDTLNILTYKVDSQEVKVSKLKFYISNIILTSLEDTAYSMVKKNHLVDFNLPNTTTLILADFETLSYDQIHFQLGIDSITNVSGALTGDLDPSKGMYWTWQSGYINLKLEGSSSISKERDYGFEYHLGGYTHPFRTVQEISLKAKSTENIRIAFDVERFIQLAGIESKSRVMSPGKGAQELSILAKSCFYWYEK